MKSILFVFLFTFPLFTFSQIDSIKGKVKSIKDFMDYDITARHSWLEGGFPESMINDETIFDDFSYDLYNKKPYEINTETDYNQHGRPISIRQYTSTLINLKRFRKNTLLESTQLVYDTAGNLIQEKAGENVTNFHYEYIAHLDKYFCSSKLMYGSDPDNYSMVQYLPTNSYNVAEVKELSRFGTANCHKFEYDNADRLVKDYSYEIMHEPGPFALEKEYIYNNDGTLKQILFPCSAPWIIGSLCGITFKYDNFKRKKQAEYYVSDSLFSRREYKYDSGNLKKMSWFIKNDSVSKAGAEYFYDKDKILVKVIFTTDTKVQSIEFKYKFDSHNNWVEQIKIADDKLLYVRKREIIYW